MIKNKIGRWYPFVAAIIYVVGGISEVRSLFSYDTQSISAFVVVLQSIDCVLIFGLAVTLFMKNKKAVLFVAGAQAVECIFGVFYNFINLFFFFVYASFVILIVLTIKGNDVVRKIWFIPVAISFVAQLFCGIYFLLNFTSLITFLVSSIVYNTVPLIFECLWLKDDIIPVDSTTVDVEDLITSLIK